MKYVERKSMIIRDSGRSSDYISPSFGYGCLYKCTYCYMRRHLPNGLTIAKNTGKILDKIFEHAFILGPKIPNQTHDKFWTYDISCNEDFVLHAKFHNWKLIFNFFKMCGLPVFATMATKNVNYDLLNYSPLDDNGDSRVRIRFSLMPQVLSDKLEPKTSKIIDRIKAINKFHQAGYEVHINYSPIIMYNDHKQDYEELFKLVNKHVSDDIKSSVKAECIFLTHNQKMHEYNVNNNVDGEDILWKPNDQETKVSQYGNINIRYKYDKKRDYIERFLDSHTSIIPWQKVRYIF
jgi:spore photoproduct lyase